MRFWTRRLMVLMLLFSWLGLERPALAVFPPPIKDEGKFLTAETLEKANKKIKEIYQEFYKDVVIETFPVVPADLMNKLKDEGKERFFTAWADRRLDELGINGIYIQIVKQPGHFHITMNKKTRDRAFTLKDRDRLAEKLLSAFREKKFDEGVLNALDLVQTTLKANNSK